MFTAPNFSILRRVSASLLLSLGLLAIPLHAHAQDYEREARWRTEIEPTIVVGDAVDIKAASGKAFLGIYAPAKNKDIGLVVAHGVGVHPDFGFVGQARTRLTDAGFATLSIQMPVQSKDAKLEDYYPKVFPDAIDRLAKAAAWMRAKGFKRVVLVSHSMGAWMANEYFDATPQAGYDAWVCIGLTGGYSNKFFGRPLPTLDLYGQNDLQPNLSAKGRRARTMSEVPLSKQVEIAGADHHYAGKEAEATQAIAAWLRTLP
jgi:predicted alpha/beta-hydrolase family hydrolase